MNRKMNRTEAREKIAMFVGEARAANKLLVRAKKIAPARAEFHRPWRDLNMALARKLSEKFNKPLAKYGVTP